MQCLLLPPIRFLVRRQIVTSYNLSLLVKNKLDLESIRSSPSDGFRVGRVGVLGGGGWYFDNDATSKIDVVFVEDGGF